MMFPRLGRGSRLMPNVLEVYTCGSGVQMKRLILDGRTRGDSSELRLERVVVAGEYI
jgi:hypothetical protein